MAALQYVDVPGYAALLLRRSYADLALPGAIMDRAKDWLSGSDAHWSEVDKTWRFPSGATLTFGYLQHEADKYRYQGGQFQFIAFDELTQFTETQYRHLFGWLRRLEGATVPIRMRGASNPGGAGHEWVKSRFIDGDRIFIPARLSDNPHLDQAEYERSMAELDPVTRQRLLLGDWEAREPGGYFDRTWFDRIDPEALPPFGRGVRRVRYWDCASTEPTGANPDPDWTVGLRLAAMGGTFYVEDVQRARKRPAAVEALVQQVADLDGSEVAIRMEEEPGSSGKAMIDHYRRYLLAGYDFRGVRSTGDKVTRAQPVSARAEAREVKLARAPWNQALIDELEAFPTGHDDQVDALSGAYRVLTLDAGRARQVPYRAGIGQPRVVVGDWVMVGEQYVDKE